LDSYVVITKAAIAEKEAYIKTKEYKDLRKSFGCGLLLRNFTKGFLVGIQQKIRTMYQNRENEMPQTQALVLVKKKDKIKVQFEEFAADLKLRTTKPTYNSSAVGFDTGKKTGDSFNINQGVNAATASRTKQIA
jgi:hypothetical protein